MNTHGTHGSAVSVSVGGVLDVGRDVLWLRAVESLPAPLVGALRDAGLTDALTLLHYPRMDTEQIGSKVYEQRSVVAASSDATSSRNRTFLTPAACSATPAGSPSSSSHPETASPGPTCSAEAGPVLVGGDPRIDQMCMVSSSPLGRGEGGLASQTAKSPASVSPWEEHGS